MEALALLFLDLVVLLLLILAIGQRRPYRDCRTGMVKRTDVPLCNECLKSRYENRMLSDLGCPWCER